VTTDQRVVTKKEIQEVESAKRAGAANAHYRNQAKDTNTKLRQQLSNNRPLRPYHSTAHEQAPGQRCVSLDMAIFRTVFDIAFDATRWRNNRNRWEGLKVKPPPLFSWKPNSFTR
jgi:isocitrate dehydrogenase